MDFTAFVQQYIKPTRWWRRKRTVQLTIWPRFLAQLLCPHSIKQPFAWSVDERTVTQLCLDCHKHLEEFNDCAHGEISLFAYDEQGSHSFRCEHCGAYLELTQVPKGSSVVSPNQTRDK